MFIEDVTTYNWPWISLSKVFFRLLICFRSSLISMSPFTKSKPTNDSSTCWNIPLLVILRVPWDLPHLLHTLLLQYFYLPSFPKCRKNHRSWGRSWLPYILHYLAREGAVMEKDRTWSLPQKWWKKREIEQRSLGAPALGIWSLHFEKGIPIWAKVPFQSFWCRDYAFFWTHKPQTCQTCPSPEGCRKMLSFGGKLWQGWVFWRPKRPWIDFTTKKVGNSWSAVDFQWLLSRSLPMSTCWSWNQNKSESSHLVLAKLNKYQL